VAGRGAGAGGAVLQTIDRGNDEVFVLRAQVVRLKERIQQLEKTNHDVEESTAVAEAKSTLESGNVDDLPSLTQIRSLQPHHISRYSRQLLLSDGFGVNGQQTLLSSSILVIGAGGIGSTVLLYLASSGVGHVTIVDYDTVEMSNLHRQIIHRDEDASKDWKDVGMNKAQSAKRAMLKLNPTISVTALEIMIDASNAMELVSKHDVVVDACDNPRTRYLLNDACVLAGKTLVSGSAMGTEGQLTVYNYHNHVDNSDSVEKKATACYRCLYPNPNPVEGCKSCSDNGVLGPVPGLIGVLQAVEVIKVLTGIGNIMHDKLLMYDSLDCSFFNIKKPPPKRNCAVCSTEATIKCMIDSEQSLEKVRGPSVCALPSQTPKLSEEQHISCSDYNELRTSGKPHVLLDVRVTRQYEMCSLEGSINIPLERLEAELDKVAELSRGELPVYCLCRRGIASAEATRLIQQWMDEGKCSGIYSVYNLKGGLNSWVKTVDSEFPQY